MIKERIIESLKNAPGPLLVDELEKMQSFATGSVFFAFQTAIAAEAADAMQALRGVEDNESARGAGRANGKIDVLEALEGGMVLHNAVSEILNSRKAGR